MSKLLTISIAAYNVEKTIEQCLNSFLPCHHLKDIEILVINDGSHDKTEEIVKNFENRVPNSIHLINKENGGHGSTLNKSLELATGTYYKAVDGDDWVDAAELDKLCDWLEKTDADLVVDDYREVFPDCSKLISLRGNYKISRIYLFDELFKGKEHLNNLFVMSNSTIRTQRLRDVGMEIQEHCFYADTELYFYIGLATRTVMFVDSCTYQYRKGYEGQSVSARGIYKHIEDLMKIESNLISLYSRISPNIESSVRRKYLFSIIDSRFTMLFDCYTTVFKRSEKDILFVKFLQNITKSSPKLIQEMHLSCLNNYILKNPSKRISKIRYLKSTCLYNLLSSIKHIIRR